MKNDSIPRRRFLKFVCSALAMIPVAIVAGKVDAATNATMRTALKYQDKPFGDKSCANCLQFVPGVAVKDMGTCKIIPGDTEISPQAYCVAWAKKG